MSKLPLLEARTSVTGTLDSDVIILFQDSTKKAIPPKGNYAGFVEKFRKSGAFEAKHGSHQYIRFSEKGAAENVLFLGAGQEAEVSEEKFRVLGGIAWTKLSAEKSRSVVIHLDSFFEMKDHSELKPIRCIRAFSEGLVLNAYQFNKYKTKAKNENEKEEDIKIIFLCRDKSLKNQLDPELAQVQAMGECVNLTRDWSNEPSNFGTPVYYASEAKRLARQYGLKYRVLTEQDAVRENMGLFLGVGQGSDREGQMVIMEYVPKVSAKAAKNLKTIALVGKGVTFDSGGISIKPSARMEEMKHDMTGAATIMGAILLAARWKVPNRVIAIMAFTENMPDANAIQPGNVLTARNGKTVEIFNTDAEGRLILADALDYAQDYKPDAVIDVATLTGAVSIALGKQCCAIMGNEETLIDSVRRAGEVNGERIWQLPLYDEYFEDLKSDYADMKNSANDPYGGAIRGAIFLKQFIKKETRWAHLDIAATAYHLTHLPYYPKKGASGAFVRTLAQFLADF